MYHKDKAAQFIKDKATKIKELSSYKANLDKVVDAFIEADYRFIEKEGLLEEESTKFYDDDKAFSFIVRELMSTLKLDNSKASQLTDTLMELLEEFIDEEDMYDWN